MSDLEKGSVPERHSSLTEDSLVASDAFPAQNATSPSFFQQATALVDDKLVLNFLPAYFVNVMATGISSSILYNFPFPAYWLKVVGVIMWGVGIFFFISSTFFMVLSCIKYPKNFTKFNTDAKIAPFMGCFAMGYNSLVNMLYFITGKSFIIGILVLWWISVLFCIYTAFIIFYFTFFVKTKQKQYFHPENMHATLLLPVVALTVTSSAGQIFAMDLPNFRLQFLVVVVSYVLWANAMAMSFIILTLIFYKYIVHKVPNTTMVFTTFIPIGFLGQGAYSIIKGGENLHQLAAQNPHMFAGLAIAAYTDNIDSLASSIATCLMLVCSLTGLFLISFGYFNTFVAIVTVMSKIFTKNPNPAHICNVEGGWRRPFNGFIKFNKGFWAITFPCGTMSISNTLLGELYDLKTFKVVGAIYGVVTVVITVFCCMGFVYHVMKDVRKVM